MKSKELILYISGRLLDDNTLGATKLNKLLYYIDNISFAELGNQVTNFTYIKQNQGPTPSPAEFLPLRDNMLAAGELGISSVLNFTGYYTQKPVANRFADITLFSPQEMSIIDRVIEMFRGWTAKAISDYSHQSIAWQATEDMEEIPNHAFFAASETPTPQEIQAARKLIGLE